MKQYYSAYTEPCKRLVGAMLFFLALLFVTPAHAAALHERQQELEPLFDAPCARYQVPKVLGGLGIAIISTSKGVITDAEARKNSVGGEVLAYIW